MLTGKVWTLEAAQKELADAKAEYGKERKCQLLRIRLAEATGGNGGNAMTVEATNLENLEAAHKAHAKALIAVIALLEIEAKEGGAT
jgi:hypothetical protein